jgi:hypothetical protein
MKIGKDDLQKRYSALSDDELMDVYINGNLTEDATSVLERELDIRGLTSKNITQRENQKKIEDGHVVPVAKIDEVRLQQLLYELEGNQNLSLGIIGGTIAAAIGAAIWAVITVGSEHQFGFMALAVGAFVGYAVRITGKGITKIYGVVGAVLSLLGCLAGNVFSACGFLSKQEGIPFFYILARLNPQIIIEIMKETFKFIDLLFYVIAISVGYRLSFRKFTEDELTRIVRA